MKQTCLFVLFPWFDPVVTLWVTLRKTLRFNVSALFRLIELLFVESTFFSTKLLLSRCFLSSTEVLRFPVLMLSWCFIIFYIWTLSVFLSYLCLPFPAWTSQTWQVQSVSRWWFWSPHTSVTSISLLPFRRNDARTFSSSNNSSYSSLRKTFFHLLLWRLNSADLQFLD